MKNKIQALILASMAILNGCIPPLYHPGAVNAPLCSHKGELNVAGGLGSSGYEFQSSYSVSDNSAVIFNWSGGNKMHSDSWDESITTYDPVTNSYSNTSAHHKYSNGFKYNYAEGGYGFYLKPQAGKKLRAEIFGLIGAGAAEATNGSVNYDAKSSYLRYSIQGDIGWLGNITEGAFSVRAGYLDFSSLQTTSYKDLSQGAWMRGSYDSFSEGSKTSLFIDPAFTFRIGYKGVKLLTQLGYSVPANDAMAFGWDRTFSSLGLQFRINTSK